MLPNHTIIREQYERMGDFELTEFARNESQKLTIESFHLLKAEFEKRKLDLSVIESAMVDKELAEATRISTFEKSTAAAFTETIWKYAFDEKLEGKTDEQIYNSLLAKNINPEYAAMLILSIEQRSKELKENFGLEITVGWVFSGIGALCIYFSTHAEQVISYLLLWGVISLVGGITRLYVSYDKKHRYEVILRNIEKEKKSQNNLYQ